LVEQTPRDDIEALGYCLIYFLLGGRLPWMGIIADTPDKMIKLIGNVKRSLPLEKLCEGKPSNYNYYYNYFVFIIILFLFYYF